MKTGRLTPEEEAAIVDMAERGRNSGTIAAKLDRSQSTINFAMHRLGLKEGPAPSPRPYIRKGSTVRPFTAQEDDLITSLRVKGMTWSEIAEAAAEMTGYQRTSATIGMRLKMLAGRDAA